MARGDVQHFDVTSSTVPSEGLHVERLASVLELQRGGRVWPTCSRGADDRRRGRQQLRIRARLELDLQVSALLRLERSLVRIARLRHEGRGHRSGGSCKSYSAGGSGR